MRILRAKLSSEHLLAFALIPEFNSAQDFIQLYGSPQDYKLVQSVPGTEIFYQQGNTSELVGLCNRSGGDQKNVQYEITRNQYENQSRLDLYRIIVSSQKCYTGLQIVF